MRRRRFRRGRRRVCRGLRGIERLQGLAQHDQRGLEIRNAARWNSPRRQRSFEEEAGFLKGGLDVAAIKILIEAGLLRQHLCDRLLQFRRQIACRCDRAEIGEQRRKAFLLGRRTLRRRRDGRALERRQHVPGLRCNRRPSGRRVDQGFGRQRDGIGGRGSGIRPLPDHGEADAIPRLRYRELQRLPFLERDLGEHVDRKARDRDPHQIGRQDLQHLRIDHASRLQHEIGRNAACLLGGKHRQHWIDGYRHLRGLGQMAKLAQRRKPLVNLARTAEPSGCPPRP